MAFVKAGIISSLISLESRYRLFATFCEVVWAGREVISLNAAVHTTIVPHQGNPEIFCLIHVVSQDFHFMLKIKLGFIMDLKECNALPTCGIMYLCKCVLDKVNWG